MSSALDTVASQYANSPRLLGMALGFAGWVNPSAGIGAFYNGLWNVKTASGYGLDVLGALVGASRTLRHKVHQTYFGFSQQPGTAPFNQAPFFNGTFEYSLTSMPDDTFRKMILLKVQSNISGHSAGTYNKSLTAVFGNEGRVYVMDSGNMSMLFIFEFALSDDDMAMLTNSGVLATPTGVKARIASFVPATTFGFRGSGLQPFGQGVFFTGAQNVD